MPATSRHQSSGQSGVDIPSSTALYVEHSDHHIEHLDALAGFECLICVHVRWRYVKSLALVFEVLMIRVSGFFSGGFFNQDNPTSLTGVGFIGIGYSSSAILACFLAFVFLACVPLVLGTRRLPGDMVIAGSNSLVISAACHASIISKVKVDWPSETEDEPDALTGESNGLIGLYHGEDGSIRSSLSNCNVDGKNNLVLARLAESKVKWGVVNMPPDFYQEFKEDMEAAYVGHLSFGVEEDDVQEPVFRKWYA